MLLSLLFTLFRVSLTYASFFNLTSNVPFADSCAAGGGVLPSNAIDFRSDYDRNFVYTPSGCKDTSQKIIGNQWTLECAPAIEAICGVTSNSSNAVLGSWTWAWHTAAGSTCQAGLWQAADANATVGIMDQACCRRIFQTLLNEGQSVSLGSASPLGNRWSTNIAPEGYPYTVSESGLDGTTVNANGAQNFVGYPSYMLAG